MNPYRRCLDALGALLSWSREVADLTLAIAQIIFGAILIWSIGYAIETDRLTVMAHGFEAFAFVTCLRILVAPKPVWKR
jgi:hypothetical protein